MSYTEWLEDRLIKHGGTGVCFETFSIDREWCRTHCTLGKMLPDKACLMRAYETEKQAETTSVIKGQISIFEGGGGIRMVRPESPCLDCERRQVGCHAECDDYIGYRERLKVYKDKVLEERKKYKMLRRHTTESERKKWKIPGGGGQW